MDWKKIALSVVTSGALLGLPVGCGDDDGAGGGPGGGPPNISGFDEWHPHACGEPGAGETLSYVVTQLILPDADEQPVPGFDLDGVDGACEIDDFTNSTFGSSIDNGLAYLAPELGIIADLDEEDDRTIEDLIADAITGGDLTMVLSMSGYNGTGDDDCVLVSLQSNFGAPVVDVPAAVVGGNVYADIGGFGLGFPIQDGNFVNLQINAALAIFDISEGFGLVGGIVDRGQDPPFNLDDASSAPEGTIHRAVYEAVSQIDNLPLSPADLAGIVEFLLQDASDIDPVGAAGGACTGMSLGVTFRAEPQ